MDDLTKETRLEQLLELTRENNKLLRKLHRGMVTRRVMTILYWIIIVGVALGSLYFLQPYLELLGQSVQQLEGVLDLFQGGAAAGTFVPTQ